LAGGDAAANLVALRRVFEGHDRGPHRAALVLQCGLALHIAGRADSIPAGIGMAASSLDSGQALRWLRQFEDYAAEVHPT
jgi:anthranilate phosphoribosyltransferase